jgi:hypothetical protein
VAHVKDNSKCWFQYTTSFTRTQCKIAEQAMLVTIDKIKCNRDEADWPFNDDLELDCNFYVEANIPDLGTQTTTLYTKDVKIAEGKEKTVGAQAVIYLTKDVNCTFRLKFDMKEDDSVWDDNMNAVTAYYQYPTWYAGFPDAKSFSTECWCDPDNEPLQKATVYWRIQSVQPNFVLR